MRKFAFIIALSFPILGVETATLAQMTPPPGSGQHGAITQSKVSGGQEPQPQPVNGLSLTSKVYWTTIRSFAAFIVGENGVIVFDTGASPEVGRQYLEAIAKVTSKPVTTIILSHGDEDHIGGLQAFPADIKICALEQTKKAIDAENAAACADRPGPKCAIVPVDHMPNCIIKERDDLTIERERMQFYHWAPAHTDNDLIVYLPEERIMLASDLIVKDLQGIPLTHRDKGGSTKGWVASVQAMLSLDASLYVVGHRGVMIRDEIEAQLQRVIAERQKVKESYDKGETLAQILAETNDPAPPGYHPNPSTQAQKADQNAEAMRQPVYIPLAEVTYRELRDGTY